jgi:hypothetical protein
MRELEQKGARLIQYLRKKTWDNGKKYIIYIVSIQKTVLKKVFKNT